MSRNKRPPMKQAEQVGSLLKQVLGDKGLDDRISRYQAWLVWDKIVGDQIAQRARPLRFRQGVLEVQVDHPVWMQQLQMLKPQILDKLNRQLPNAGITDIYLRRSASGAARRAEQPIPETPDWQKEQLSADEEQYIEEQLKSLKNPELRDELRRLHSLQMRLDKGRKKNN